MTTEKRTRTRTPTHLVMCQVWWWSPETDFLLMSDGALQPLCDQRLSLAGWPSWGTRWAAEIKAMGPVSLGAAYLCFFSRSQAACITQIPGGEERKCR